MPLADNMDGSEFIRLVTKDNEECFLLTKLKAAGKEGFDMALCHDGKVWTGQVSEDDLDSLSTRLKMDFNPYVEQTVEALTTMKDAQDTFQYQMKRQRDNLEFIWKKHVPAEDITFQLGSASLKVRADSTEYITKLFNVCIKSMKELKERIRHLETDNERLSQERINALKRLEKCVVAKEELEQDLYSKFTLVLNSKKEKIRQLKRQVEEGITEESVVETQGEAKPSSSKTSTKPSTKIEDTKQTDSESDRDTDEDTPKPKRAKQSQVRASQNKSKGDDSLVLEEEEEKTTVVARPRRQRGRQQKQTPSKPVLPRVGSNESDTGSERKSRLRKTPSARSNTSSDNIDAEDLMGDL